MEMCYDGAIVDVGEALYYQGIDDKYKWNSIKWQVRTAVFRIVPIWAVTFSLGMENKLNSMF